MGNKKQTPIAPFATPTEMLLHNMNTGGKCLKYFRMYLASSGQGQSLSLNTLLENENEAIRIPDGANNCILYVETQDPVSKSIRIVENNATMSSTWNITANSSLVPVGVPLDSGTFYEIGSLENIMSTQIRTKPNTIVVIHFHFYS